MKATIDGTVVAEAADDELIEIEGNQYFPPTAVRADALRDSPTQYTCPWKGAAQYYDVVAGSGVHSDAAWSYPTLLESAVHTVGRDFAGYVAFDTSVVSVG